MGPTYCFWVLGKAFARLQPSVLYLTYSSLSTSERLTSDLGVGERIKKFQLNKYKT